MAKFKKGDKVQLKHNPEVIGFIEKVKQFYQGLQYYEVFINGYTSIYGENQLRLYQVEKTILEFLIDGVFDDYYAFQRLITYRRLQKERPLSNNIFAFNASRTLFFPYQFKPLLKFLDSTRNCLLLADEVGLGKTIEAGLIFTELSARQDINTVLIIVPSNLRTKWQDEMWRRFGHKFEIFTAKDFKAFIGDSETAQQYNEVKAIISFGAVRQQSILEMLQNSSYSFDLVIVDEAHHVRNRGTCQWEAINYMRPNITNILFLTATPIQLGNENLATLLSLLDSEEFIDDQTVFDRIKLNKPIVRAMNILCKNDGQFSEAITELMHIIENPRYGKEDKITAEKLVDNLTILDQHELDSDEYYNRLVDIQYGLNQLNLLGHIFTRTRKRDVMEEISLREASSITVHPTVQEKEFYNAVTRFIPALYNRIKNIGFRSFILHVPQRRMASCIPAMVQYYRDFFKSHTSLLDQDFGEDIDVELEEIDKYDDDYKAAQDLARIIKKWDENNSDSKYLELKKILMALRRDEGRIKVLIFAFFRDTLDYLLVKLQSDGFNATLIHGKVNQEERFKRIESFKEDKNVEILLSSRVGSEGLDFQFCSTLINYDLPWNPMEIEQRIGRLDRIGQKSSKILIYNLQIEGTIEQRILSRLYDRVGVFRESIGDLEDILGELFHNLDIELISKKLTEEQENEIIERKLLVFEQAKKERAILDGQQGQLLGFDDYFDREVKQIQKNKRYVTADQMRQFFEDFIQNYCKNTQFQYNEKNKIGIIKPDQKLREKMSHAGFASSVIATRDSSKVVFEREVAFNNDNFEFINILHPLVQTIVKEYQNNEGLKSKTHCLHLSTDIVAPGGYFYLIFLLDVEGLMPYTSLEMVLLTSEGKRIYDQRIEEQLLGEMVERGERYRAAPPKSNFGRLYEIAENIFLRREQDIYARRLELNRRLVDRRLDSIIKHFDRLIEQHERILRKAEIENKKENYLRMQRGRIQKFKNNKSTQIMNIENKRELSVSHQDLAAGFVVVKEGI